LSSAIIVAVVAAMPVEKARHSAPPSRIVSLSSSARTVGFPERE
jgi:hypothetical protein